MREHAAAQKLEASDVDSSRVDMDSLIESNANLIEWSDGTYGFAIGDEIFEIRAEDLQYAFVFLKHEAEMAICKGKIDKKLFIKPTERSNRHCQQYKAKINEQQKKK